MTPQSNDPARRTPVYRDRTGTWVIAIAALLIAFGLALWGITGDTLKTAMNPPVAETDTNTGVMTGSAPAFEARRP